MANRNRITAQERLHQLRQFLHGRQYAYRQTFGGVHGSKVLEDLAVFCRANQSTFHPDPHVASKLDGRREVFLRIAEHLKLSPADYFDLVVGKQAASPQANEVSTDE